LLNLNTRVKSIVCALGMLTSKFRILESLINNKIDTLVKALCALHNFIRNHDGVYSTSQEPEASGENCCGIQFHDPENSRNITRPSNLVVVLRD